jgi:Protein of unknown function (DUF3795)
MKEIPPRSPDLITREMIAPCGMDCALCMAISRKKDQCPGCRGPDEGKPKYCVACKMVVCDLAPEGPDGRFCITCGSFPCKRLKDIDKRYRTKYSMSMIENLGTIKDEGLDRFIEMEKKKWICKGCGGIVSVHRDNCLVCGYKWR